MTCTQHYATDTFPSEAGKEITTVYADDPATNTTLLHSLLERDGAVIVKNLFSKSLCAQIKEDLKPIFDADKPDPAGFFPSTTKRAHGILAQSPSSAKLVVNPLFQSVAEAMLTSRYTYWEGQKQKSVAAKPQIASIVGFRVEPGGKQQPLHRDDSDYHTRNCDMPVMLGCVTVFACPLFTNDNMNPGLTIVINSRHCPRRQRRTARRSLSQRATYGDRRGARSMRRPFQQNSKSETQPCSLATYIMLEAQTSPSTILLETFLGSSHQWKSMMLTFCLPVLGTTHVRQSACSCVKEP